MKITSFDDTTNNKKIIRDSEQDYLFNLFQKNIVNDPNLPLKVYVVPREYEMRLDRISNHIYGSPNYVEELMVLNDIINPYSVKEGQYIYFCQVENLKDLYVKDDTLSTKETNRKKLLSSQKDRQKKQLNDNQNLPPTVKPSNLDQIKITKDNTVKIINKFQ